MFRRGGGRDPGASEHKTGAPWTSAVFDQVGSAPITRLSLRGRRPEAISVYGGHVHRDCFGAGAPRNDILGRTPVIARAERPEAISLYGGHVHRDCFGTCAPRNDILGRRPLAIADPTPRANPAPR